MRDVEMQLRDYFDAAVERVTVEDVFARQQVAAQGAAKRRRFALRPAWAAVAAFVATLVVLGGSLGLGIAVRDGGRDAGSVLLPETVSESAAGTSGGWVLITAIAITMAAVVALIVRNQHVRARKERAMATTIETSSSEQLKAVERSNRWLVVTVVVLAVALVALGAWVLYDLASEPDTAPSAEIDTLIDDYIAAWNAHDPDAFRALTTEDYRFGGPGDDINRDIQANAIMASSTLDIQRVGEAVMMEDGEEYYVTTANEISYGGGEYVGVSALRIVETEDGLKVAAHAWLGNM